MISIKAYKTRLDLQHHTTNRFTTTIGKNQPSKEGEFYTAADQLSHRVRVAPDAGFGLFAEGKTRTLVMGSVSAKKKKSTVTMSNCEKDLVYDSPHTLSYAYNNPRRGFRTYSGGATARDGIRSLCLKLMSLTKSLRNPSVR